jgi:hypothetical protein
MRFGLCSALSSVPIYVKWNNSLTRQNIEWCSSARHPKGSADLCLLRPQFWFIEWNKLREVCGLDRIHTLDMWKTKLGQSKLRILLSLQTFRVCCSTYSQWMNSEIQSHDCFWQQFPSCLRRYPRRIDGASRDLNIRVIVAERTRIF